MGSAALDAFGLSLRKDLIQHEIKGIIQKCTKMTCRGCGGFIYYSPGPERDLQSPTLLGYRSPLEKRGKRTDL